ncbi:MAG: nicotinate (nicotinamide) nucleotide adenylyltransferase, partial [Bacteroidota bacterium]|nr:nicotinate (nicotinamide) nucleotide adenylyltransferase [Bacteroidota bacterium]
MKKDPDKIGLFFGSFNPIHSGHLIIAGYMTEFTDITQVWFIISPQNPLKEKSTLLKDHHRLAMAQIAVEDDPRFRASNIEFHLPRPSYTIDTLTYLSEKYPDKKFVLLSGTDIFPTFHKWKNYEVLLDLYHFYVYPRRDSGLGQYEKHPHIHL